MSNTEPPHNPKASPGATAAVPGATAAGPPGATAAVPPGITAVLIPAVIGSLVIVTLGVYGNLHDPSSFSVNVAGFSSPQAVKAWLATAALALAVLQVVSALVMYGKFPGVSAPPWIGAAHRWTGRLAVLVSVPVAVHCLYALGFDSSSARVLWHSMFGCFFYGAFVSKMLLLSRRGVPGWALPVFGGLVFTGLVGLWVTSALWFFQTSGLTF